MTDVFHLALPTYHKSALEKSSGAFLNGVELVRVGWDRDQQGRMLQIRLMRRSVSLSMHEPE